jgi:hypothetical protein
VASSDYEAPAIRRWRSRKSRTQQSYYHAALAGTLNLRKQYDDLAALTPVVRALPGMSADDVNALVQLSLGDLVRGLDDPAALVAQVAAAQRALSPDVHADARALDARGAPDLAPSHVPPANTPEQPSTPVSLFAPLTPPPRTAVTRGSLGAPPAPASEHRRLTAAVA